MKLSLVSHYYNNEAAVKRILSSFQSMAEQFPNFFEFVLVDDHSHEEVDPSIFSNIPNLRVFRVIEDVAWNMAGARNIAVSEIRTDKFLIMDIDHVLHPEDVRRLLDLAARLQPMQRVRMERLVELENGETKPIRSVFNCFLMSKKDFDTVGGYEEAFSGHYGLEDKWFKVCCEKNGIKDLMSDVRLLVRKEHSTKKLNRDQSRNLAVIESLYSEAKFRSQNNGGYSYEKIYESSD